MDQGPLVEAELETGGKFIAEFQKEFPVRLAFWLKNAETGKWRLYVVSDHINDDNHGEAIKQAVRVIGKIQVPWFDVFSVGVLGSHELLAKDVMKIQAEYIGVKPVRVFHRYVAHRDAEEIYMYAAPDPVPVSS